MVLSKPLSKPHCSVGAHCHIHVFPKINPPSKKLSLLNALNFFISNGNCHPLQINELHNNYLSFFNHLTKINTQNCDKAGSWNPTNQSTKITHHQGSNGHHQKYQKPTNSLPNRGSPSKKINKNSPTNSLPNR